MKHETKPINISMLEINTENPRFEMVGNQREAIGVMIESQKNRLARLAQDIIEQSLGSDLFFDIRKNERTIPKNAKKGQISF